MEDKFIEIFNSNFFGTFLFWFNTEVERFEAESVTVSDKVIVKNQRGDIIAYKSSGLIGGKPTTKYFIRERELELMSDMN